MQAYYGAKLIHAEPANKGVDEGYFVKYEDGYTSWSPKAVFEKAYRPVEGLPFGLALEAMKQGKKVARAGWNGKGMWLRMIHPYAPHPDTGGGNPAYANPYFKAADNNPEAVGTMLPWIGMKTADNHFVPWLASQTDMLAEDWEILQ